MLHTIHNQTRVDLSETAQNISSIVVEAAPFAATGQAVHVAGYSYSYYCVRPMAMAEDYPAFAAVWDNDADDDYANL